MPADLVISIINHSNPHLLRECLRSIVDGTHGITYEVWVVDNATGEKDLGPIYTEFPEVRWLYNDSRKGFSANHNQVLTRAIGRHLCILNDDTIIHEGAFARMVSYLDENSAVGMAGPRTLNPDGSYQMSVFNFPSLRGELLGYAYIPGGDLVKRSLLPQWNFAAEPQAVDWLLGACIVVRSEALAKIGPLDEVLSPFAYAEDSDWCMMAHRAGYEVHFVPGAIITHYGAQSIKDTSTGADMSRVRLHRAGQAWFRKHRGLRAELAVRAIHVGLLPWNALMIAQSVVRRRRDWRSGLKDLKTRFRIAVMSLRP